MGLSSALGVALSGLQFVETGVELVSRNIANADTPGYTRKSIAPVSQLLGNGISTIRPGAITRDVDAFLQQQIRTETGIAGFLDVRDKFLSQIDQLFGRPGAANALDSIVNDFGQSLQALSTTPENFGTRDAVVAQAQTLARQLNGLSDNIQDLRRQAENQIADAVDQANAAIQGIAQINQQISALQNNATGTAQLADERDRFINQLSELLDITVTVGEQGVARVFTTTGNLLVGTEAATLSFDERASLTPASLYDFDDTKRGVGTLLLGTVAGSEIDLFKNNSLRSGRIVALKQMRDETLVEAQNQLDELAHGLALSMSTNRQQGQPVTVGASSGFDLDLTGLESGNEITVSFTRTPPGTNETYTFIRVDDPATLPLADEVTANPSDMVVGIDFSGGFAGAVAAIDAALGASITVSSPAADTLRILDDGAAGTIALDTPQAAITSTSTVDNGVQLALFVDLDGSVKSYSNDLDGTPQKIGFAQRIAVNPGVEADNTALVVYSTSPATGIGDPARPLELIDRFAQQGFTFHPDSGIGSAASPLVTSVSSFAQRIVSFQGQMVESSSGTLEAQGVVLSALQERFDQDTTVKVDDEMSRLLVLQNAYAANARVISAVRDLIDILRRI